MSFLSGLLSVGKSAVNFIRGNSIASSLTKTALMGFALSKLSANANKSNDLGQTANIDQGVRLQIPPAADNKIPVLYGTAFFGGVISDAEMTNNNKTMWYCLTLAEQTGTKYSDSSATAYTFKDVYWNDQRIVFESDGITASYAVDRSGNIDRSIAGLVRVYCYGGGSTAGQVPDGYTGSVANADTLMPNWESATHPMTNLIFALVRVDYNREKNVTGIGNMLFEVESDMFLPGDVLYDYFTNTTFGAGISASNIETTSLTALNTYSAQSVSYEDQGTGAETLADRYQINGLLDTGDTVLDNIEKVCNASGSWLGYDVQEGKWNVIINKTDSSAATFDDSNILGSISVSGTGLQDLYNSVKVEFPHRELRDSADFIKVEINDADRNANEEDNTLNIAYDIINEPVQAEMLGLIELKQSRIDLLINFQTDFSYINLKAGDVIDVTNDRLGFSSKEFRIITISEVQDNDGALLMEITALEYDANVYSTADLFRFTRTDENGIITIGSIGVPGTPQVTKYEVDSRPRIEIETTAPTGVIEGIEFWLTTDVEEADDANRSYTLVATKKPVGGGTYTSGTEVVLDYDALGTSNFFIKTRGFNTTAVGPYSDPSGLVEFEPTQTTQAIDPNTVGFDETGGLLTALALVDLLKGVDDIFGGEAGEGSIFSKIFDIFQDETGVDLVGEASGGELVVSSNLSVKADGTEVSATTASLDFIGPIEATGSSDVSVKLTDGTANKDVLAWNSETSSWELLNAANCLSGCEFVPEPEPEPEVIPCRLTVVNTLPASNHTLAISNCGLLNNLVPRTGSYFVSFTSNTNPIYSAIQTGSGNVSLYKTDGTLVQQVSAGNLLINKNVVEIPFTAARELNTDYYILMDEGVVTYCGCPNEAINDPTTWDFTIAPYDITPYDELTASDFADVEASTSAVSVVSTEPQSAYQSGICKTGNELKITFGELVVKGSGLVTLTRLDTGSTVEQFNVSSATLEDRTLNFGTLTNLVPGIVYRVSAPADIVKSSRIPCQIDDTYEVGNVAFDYTFTTLDDLALVDYTMCSDPYDLDLDFSRVNIRSNIRLNFNRDFIPNLTGSNKNITIYEQGGTVHQAIDITDTFETDYVGRLTQFLILEDAQKTAYYEIHQLLLEGKTTEEIVAEGYEEADITAANGLFRTNLNINPTKPFKPNTSYYLQITSGAFLDDCGVAYAGISDTSTVTWSTDKVSVNEAEDVDITTPFETQTVELTFDKQVQPGGGKLNIVDDSGNLLYQISPDDPRVQIVG